MRPSQKIIIALAVVSGLIVGALAMSAAWDLNPQGEFHATDGSGKVHWRAWLQIGTSWFVVGFGSLWLPASAVELAVRWWRSRSA